MISSQLLLLAGIGLLGLAVVAILFSSIRKLVVGNHKAEQIAAAIHSGAMTFLREEYKIIAIVVAIVAVILGWIFSSALAALIFISGAFISMLIGFIGMHAATLQTYAPQWQQKIKVNMQHLWLHFLVAALWVLRLQVLVYLALGTIFYLFYGHPDFIVFINLFWSWCKS